MAVTASTMAVRQRLLRDYNIEISGGLGELRGKVNGGGPTLTLRTSGGGIRVKSLTSGDFDFADLLAVFRDVEIATSRSILEIRYARIAAADVGTS